MSTTSCRTLHTSLFKPALFYQTFPKFFHNSTSLRLKRSLSQTGRYFSRKSIFEKRFWSRKTMTLKIGSLNLEETSLVGTLILDFAINWGAWVFAALLKVLLFSFPSRSFLDRKILWRRWDVILHSRRSQCLDQRRTLPCTPSKTSQPFVPSCEIRSAWLRWFWFGLGDLERFCSFECWSQKAIRDSTKPKRSLWNIWSIGRFKQTLLFTVLSFGRFRPFGFGSVVYRPRFFLPVLRIPPLAQRTSSDRLRSFWGSCLNPLQIFKSFVSSSIPTIVESLFRRAFGVFVVTPIISARFVFGGESFCLLFEVWKTKLSFRYFLPFSLCFCYCLWVGFRFKKNKREIDGVKIRLIFNTEIERRYWFLLQKYGNGEKASFNRPFRPALESRFWKSERGLCFNSSFVLESRF